MTKDFSTRFRNLDVERLREILESPDEEYVAEAREAAKRELEWRAQIKSAEPEVPSGSVAAANPEPLWRRFVGFPLAMVAAWLGALSVQVLLNREIVGQTVPFTVVVVLLGCAGLLAWLSKAVSRFWHRGVQLTLGSWGLAGGAEALGLVVRDEPAVPEAIAVGLTAVLSLFVVSGLEVRYRKLLKYPPPE